MNYTTQFRLVTGFHQRLQRQIRIGCQTSIYLFSPLAVLFKLIERGEIKSSDRVVVISTAHGLKFTNFKVGYHDQTLDSVVARHANPPLELPASYDAVSKAIDQAFDN